MFLRAGAGTKPNTLVKIPFSPLHSHPGRMGDAALAGGDEVIPSVLHTSSLTLPLLPHGHPTGVSHRPPLGRGYKVDSPAVSGGNDSYAPVLRKGGFSLPRRGC